TDNTREVVQPYLERFAGVITYIYQENRGIARTRNRGLRRARGEYIAFLDSDDCWLPDNLALKMRAFEQSPREDLGAVFSDYFIEEAAGMRQEYLKTRGFFRCFRRELIKEEDPSYSLGTGFYARCVRNNFQPMFTAAVMVKRSVLESIGFFAEDLQVTDDLEMWYRITKRYRVAFVNRPLAVYYRSRSGITSNKAKLFYWCVLCWKKMLRGEKSWSLRFAMSRIISRYYVCLGGVFRRQGMKRKAGGFYRMSIAYWMLNYRGWRGIISLGLKGK
ncbi:MAG: glycosyltransferase, partial [Candidatus Omnitrophica bacterium]|nr:glycosyltransferase [Candidatus Omnitrophota bacterium]